MPRIPRCDAPDVWFHLMNRGIARRPIFETASDARFFSAQLARSVREGLIELHAYCVMTTHFHLLVRSPCGRVSDAMERAQSVYARWFNRGRQRDGPLFRGRFRSARVRSLAHRSAVVAYIDRNPIEAGIVRAPTAYPHGSAARHARSRPTRWMERGIVEGIIAERGGAVGAGPAGYDRAVLGCAPEALTEFVEGRLRDTPLTDDAGPADDDPLDDLVRAAAPRVQAWMAHKASLADATAPGLAIVSASTVTSLIAQSPECRRLLRLSQRPRTASELLGPGLLRTVCGLRLAEIAQRTDCAISAAERRVIAHIRALRTDGEYAALAARVVHAALRADFPAQLREFDLPRNVPAFPGGIGR